MIVICNKKKEEGRRNSMTKAQFLEELKLYIGRMEEGEIFDDIEMDEDIEASDVLSTIAELIS